MKKTPAQASFDFSSFAEMARKSGPAVAAALFGSQKRTASKSGSKKSKKVPVYHLPWYAVAIPLLVAVTLVAIPVGWFIHQSGQLGSRAGADRRTLLMVVMALMLAVIFIGRTGLK